MRRYQVTRIGLEALEIVGREQHVELRAAQRAHRALARHARDRLLALALAAAVAVAAVLGGDERLQQREGGVDVDGGAEGAARGERGEAAAEVGVEAAEPVRLARAAS
jgi:hypothetical protein